LEFPLIALVAAVVLEEVEHITMRQHLLLQMVELVELVELLMVVLVIKEQMKMAEIVMAILLMVLAAAVVVLVEEV
jgi:hypothetical protein